MPFDGRVCYCRLRGAARVCRRSRLKRWMQEDKGETDMSDSGKKDKRKRERQKKAKLSLKEKRQRKKEKKG